MVYLSLLIVIGLCHFDTNAEILTKIIKRLDNLSITSEITVWSQSKSKNNTMIVYRLINKTTNINQKANYDVGY